MAVFGWIAGDDKPPARWDLRDLGWTLCRGLRGCRAECRHVLVCDARRLDPENRLALARADRPAWRLILLGVECSVERARLLSLGCAEALSAETALPELEARARRVKDMCGLLPRWRDLGPLTLDLFHRDARRGQCWVGLHPREFGLLWRLADTPGRRVSRRQLIADVWRLSHEPETNSVEVHVSRLRTKLAAVECETLIETAPEGGYRLADPFRRQPAHPLVHADDLDDFLIALNWASSPA